MVECNVVRDLLPIYINGQASEETEAEVKQHLLECSECNKLLEQLKVPIKNTELETTIKENNHLKEMYAKSVKKIGIRLAIILCIFPVLSYLFILGLPVSIKDIEYTQKVENGQLVIDLKLTNGKELHMKTEHAFKEKADGTAAEQTIILKPYGVLPSPIYDNTGFSFFYEYENGIDEEELSNEELAQVKIIIQLADDKVVLVPKDILK